MCYTIDTKGREVNTDEPVNTEGFQERQDALEKRNDRECREEQNGGAFTIDCEKRRICQNPPTEQKDLPKSRKPSSLHPQPKESRTKTEIRKRG